uniref:Uncharacterized protein n=1 Tax=Magallana gigas TaxID=29159 RepID=A0A8W8KFR7_MAGGI
MQHIEPTFKFIWERFAELCEELKLLKGEKEKKEEEEKEEKKEEKEKRKGEEKKECLKEPDITDIFSWENESGLTPLRLSAKFGVSELFKYLINIEGQNIEMMKKKTKKDRCASILKWSWMTCEKIEMARKRRKRN